MINVNRIDTELTGAASIAISGHIRPDGDCVGSCMGLYLYLKENFPEIRTIDVYLQEIPDSFSIISDVNVIRHTCSENEVYDLFIALDCGDLSRLGEFAACFENAKRTLCYDHHISNKAFADVNYVDPEISSASELIFLTMDPDKISRKTAEALYMGIVHDTGIFQYSCTSPETMERAAMLMRKGINHSLIVDTTYMEKSYLQNQILGRALVQSELLFDGSCIVSGFSIEDMERYGITHSDLDGIVSQLRLTKGVETAVFIYETKRDEFKVSLRSKAIMDVSTIAGLFGGGGHKRAAGCTICGTYREAVKLVTDEIAKQNELLNCGRA